MRECWYFIKGVSQRSPPDTVTWRQRSARRWGASHGGIWEKTVLGSRNSTCKGPETGVCLRNNKEARVTGEEQARERMTDFCLFNKIQFSTHHVPDIVLGTLHILIHLLLTTTL